MWYGLCSYGVYSYGQTAVSGSSLLSICGSVLDVAVPLSSGGLVLSKTISISHACRATPLSYLCTDMCIDMCIAMCVDMCIAMCVDMCIDMCIDMCVDMCVDMCQASFGHGIGPASGGCYAYI